MARIREYTLDDLTDSLGAGADLTILGTPNPVIVSAKKGDGADITPTEGIYEFVMPSGVTAMGIWINKDSDTNTTALLTKTTNSVALWAGFTGGSTEIRWFNGGQVFLISDAFELNTFERLFLAYDGTNAYIYVNGILKGSGADATGITSGNWGIGGTQGSGDFAFPGVVDEFYVYDDALTSEADAFALAATDLSYATPESPADPETPVTSETETSAVNYGGHLIGIGSSSLTKIDQSPGQSYQDLRIGSATVSGVEENGVVKVATIPQSSAEELQEGVIGGTPVLLGRIGERWFAVDRPTGAADADVEYSYKGNLLVAKRFGQHTYL